MDLDFDINETRKDTEMVLVTNEILDKLKNEYIELENKLTKFKNIMSNNEFNQLEFKYYNGDLNLNDKENFLNYKKTIEKLQLETNIKESYYTILEAFQRKQVEYATFVSERDNKLNFIKGNETNIPFSEIDNILREAQSNQNILINIHNHPRDSFISNSDLKLLTNKNISSMHIISGSRIQIFNKLENFDLIEFNVLFKNKFMNLLINKDKTYSNDFNENKLIQREIQLLSLNEKQDLLKIIEQEIQSKKINSDPLEPFSKISELAIKMNISIEEYEENFEKVFQELVEKLINENKLEFKIINFS